MQIKNLAILAVALAAISTAAQAQPRPSSQPNLKQQCQRYIIDQAKLRTYLLSCSYTTEEARLILAADEHTDQFIKEHNCQSLFTDAEINAIAQTESNRIGHNPSSRQICAAIKPQLPQIIGRYTQ